MWLVLAALVAAFLVWRKSSTGGATDVTASDPSTNFDPWSGLTDSADEVFGLPQNVSDLIDKYAAQYGVDPNLAKAQAVAESGGNQNAKSRKGAIGVFQLTPGTAADLGVDPYNLEQNVEGGVKYLSQMLARFGDPALALAAYNAGPGNVVKYNGIPPFPETQSYVAKILGMIGVG